MTTLFRKILIRSGKVIPFMLAFIVAFGYIESAYAIYMELFEECEDGSVILYTPISNYIGSMVYIDWFDVFLLYILAIALEFCKYNMREVHYLLLNLFIRVLLEHFYLDNLAVIHICAFMALLGLYCVYGGFKMIPQQRGKF